MIVEMILSISIGMAAGATQGFLRPVTLDQLTVPIERLPAGCALSPAASERAGDQVRAGLWAGLPISTNPWVGTDTRLIALISERIAPSRMPDGPPLTMRESTRVRANLANGVEEAYAAIYVESSLTPLVVVHGLGFASTDDAGDFLRNARASNRSTRVAVATGRIVATVSGDGGQCFQAVEAHLESIAK